MTEKTKRTRLNIRVPTPLLQWARDISKTKNTNVTQFIVDLLTKEQMKWLRKGGFDV